MIVALGLLAFALLWLWLSIELRDAVEVATPTCDCGREILRDAHLADSTQYASLCAQLTGLCPRCSYPSRDIDPSRAREEADSASSASPRATLSEAI